jgi:S-disulfanyl-L-cysteine oxidoreductase SoxD
VAALTQENTLPSRSHPGTKYASLPALLLLPLLAAQSTRSVWDGIYTPEQARRGAALYAAQCASCHGLNLTGGESAPPLTGGEFMSNWSGLTVGDLFERIRTSMPADRPGSLPREQNSDILAHILNVADFPPGTTELSSRTEILKEIRLDATRPAH